MTQMMKYIRHLDSKKVKYQVKVVKKFFKPVYFEIHVKSKPKCMVRFDHKHEVLLGVRSKEYFGTPSRRILNEVASVVEAQVIEREVSNPREERLHGFAWIIREVPIKFTNRKLSDSVVPNGVSMEGFDEAIKFSY